MERACLEHWVAATGSAERHGVFTLLRDPHWNAAESRGVTELLAAHQPEDARRGWLLIRTGGSGGSLKLARHDERTLGAAVAGFCAHFDFERVNAVGVLPPWHISGLMARVRCGVTGGVYRSAEWKAVEAGAFPDMDESGAWTLSLVPTQLQRLLGNARAEEWLRRFAIVFVGGGPTWPALADAAAAAGLPVSLSYGMTETAAMVAAQRPAEFLAGDRSVGRPLPHATINIGPNDRIEIAAESLFCGYFPNSVAPAAFVTDDLGKLGPDGRLTVLGRADAIIISGGKKIDPFAVEAALRASGEFDDVAVLGMPDPEWGEAVVACYPADGKVPDLSKAAAALAPYQRPKRFAPIAPWPRTAQGKIDRAALAARVARAGSAEQG